MNAPVNRRAAEARQAMIAHNAEVAELQESFVPDLYPYYLTWPASCPAACCVAGQWRNNAAGEIEAWYTEEQLRFIVAGLENSKAREDVTNAKN